MSKKIHFSTVYNKLETSEPSINRRRQTNTEEYLYNGLLLPSKKQKKKSVQCLLTEINVKNRWLRKNKLQNYMHHIIASQFWELHTLNIIYEYTYVQKYKISMV